MLHEAAEPKGGAGVAAVVAGGGQSVVLPLSRDRDMTVAKDIFAPLGIKPIE